MEVPIGVTAENGAQPRRGARALASLTFDQTAQALIAGDQIRFADGAVCGLGEAARKALYFHYADAKRLALWKDSVGNLRPGEGEELILAIEGALPEIASPDDGRSTSGPLWHVEAMTAEQFGGLHAHCVEGGGPPPALTLRFRRLLELLQARNSAGKSQLVKAVAWCLTGQIPRALGEPGEPKTNAYTLEPETREDGEAWEAEPSIDLPVIVPAPGRQDLHWRGDGGPLVATAVTLDLLKHDGGERCRIRRRIVAHKKGYTTIVERIDPDTGAVQEVGSAAEALGVSVASLEATSLMMARLPFLRLDGPNALVGAVKILTGLQPFENLAERCKRSTLPRLQKTIPENARKEMAKAVKAFEEEAAKLPSYFRLGSPLPEGMLPPAPDESDGGKACDIALVALGEELGRRDAELRTTIAKATGLDVAEADLAALRKAVQTARTALAAETVESWAEVKALKTLQAIDATMAAATYVRISDAVQHALAFTDLAKYPDEAERRRLYVAIDQWRQANPPKDGWPPCACPVCRTDLDGKTDDVLELPVRDALDRAKEDTAAAHLDAKDCDSALASYVMEGLPAQVRAALGLGAPWDLLRRSCTKTAQARLSGDLAPLQKELEAEFDRLAGDLPKLKPARSVTLPATLDDGNLVKTITTVLRVLDGAEWCLEAGGTLDGIRAALFGAGNGDAVAAGYLPGRLDALEKALGDDGPVDSARRTLATLRSHQETWNEQRGWINRAVAALPAVRELVDLGRRIEMQVKTLIKDLDEQTREWTRRLYLPANATAPALVGTRLDGDAMRVQVQRDGVSGDGRELVNSSGLRTHLFAFTLALAKRIRENDGGVSLLLLDDPQTLFDEHNQRRVAKALGELPRHGFRPLITTYDQHFAGSLFRQAKDGDVDFLQLFPRSTGEGCSRIRRHHAHIDAVREDWKRSDHDPVRIRAFCAEARVMIEQALRDLIWPSPAIVAGDETMQPLMVKLQKLMARGGPYAAAPFADLKNHQALKDSDFRDATCWAHHFPADDLAHFHAKRVDTFLEPLLNTIEKCRGVLDEALSQGPLSTLLAPSVPEAEIVAFPVHGCPALSRNQIGRAAAEGGGEVDDDDTVGTAIGFSLVDGRHQLFGVGKALTWMPRLLQPGDVLIVDRELVATDGLALVWDGARGQAEAGWLKPVRGRPGAVVLVGDHDRDYAREFDTGVNECHPIVGILFGGARTNAGKALEPLDECGRFADVEGTVIIDQGNSAEPLLHVGDSVLVGARVGEPGRLGGLAGQPVAVRLEGGRRLVKRLGEKPLDATGRVWVLDNLGTQGNGAVIRLGDDVPDGFAAIPRAEAIRPILGYWFSRGA